VKHEHLYSLTLHFVVLFPRRLRRRIWCIFISHQLAFIVIGRHRFSTGQRERRHAIAMPRFALKCIAR